MLLQQQLQEMQRQAFQANQQYQQQQLPFQLLHSKISSLVGCGPSVIAMLNVVDAFEVKRRYDVAGITEEQMVKELRDGGWEVTEIKDDVIYTDESRILDPVTDDHIVLLSMRTTLNQNSWGVFWDGNIYHCSELIPVDKLMCFNRIFIKKWLLWHPKLKNHNVILSENVKQTERPLTVLPAEYTREDEQLHRDFGWLHERLYRRP